MKIHHFFFINFAALFIGTLLVVSIVSFFSLKSLIISQTTERLSEEIALIALNTLEKNNLDQLAHDIYTKTQSRTTFIDAQGTVLAESSADKYEMENHADRYEVMQANVNDFGIDIRHSHTLGADYIYVAKKVQLGNDAIYIRLSESLANVMDVFYNTWSKLALTFGLVLMISLIISYKTSQRIRYDIKQITDYLLGITNKEYKSILKTKYFKEFLHISILLKDLVKKLNAREKQKRKYTAKLRLINKQRNDVLSAISHEFKNPIAAIMGYAETIQDDPAINPKIRTKFLEKILSNSKKITTMIDRLSLSVKLENEDLKVAPVSFDILDLIQEVVLNLSKKFSDRTINVSGENILLYADKTMIEMVLINLIDNAMKYSEEDVTVAITDNKVMVIDKGMGISSNDIDKISSKFYRVDKNTWDNSMGLGLAIVSYILKLHKSELEIQSKPQEGSIFSFSLKTLQKD